MQRDRSNWWNSNEKTGHHCQVAKRVVWSCVCLATESRPYVADEDCCFVLSSLEAVGMPDIVGKALGPAAIVFVPEFARYGNWSPILCSRRLCPLVCYRRVCLRVCSSVRPTAFLSSATNLHRQSPCPGWHRFVVQPAPNLRGQGTDNTAE
jgi:hypothetical protein